MHVQKQYPVNHRVEEGRIAQAGFFESRDILPQFRNLGGILADPSQSSVKENEETDGDQTDDDNEGVKEDCVYKGRPGIDQGPLFGSQKIEPEPLTGKADGLPNGLHVDAFLFGSIGHNQELFPSPFGEKILLVRTIDTLPDREQHGERKTFETLLEGTRKDLAVLQGQNGTDPERSQSPDGIFQSQDLR